MSPQVFLIAFRVMLHHPGWRRRSLLAEALGSKRFRQIAVLF